MIRKNFFALAAATAMTLSTFAGTLAVLSVGAPATAHQASVA